MMMCSQASGSKAEDLGGKPIAVKIAVLPNEKLKSPDGKEQRRSVCPSSAVQEGCCR